MSPQPEDRRPPENLPRARVERNWKSYLIWLLPVAAAGFVGWLVYTTLIATGPTLHLYFSSAQDLQPGNAQVKYRGTKIGTVESMHLAKDHQSVDIKVSLEKSAAGLARAGSVFWIVKPQVSLGQIQGLQTIVSGAYIAVRPGHGKRQTRFKGLSEPPVHTPEQKGLKLVLLADKLGSVQRRAPVYYREVQVGEVLDFEFTGDRHALQIPIWINEAYVSLLGANSRFWDAGGLRVQMSLGGIQVNTESVKALVAGGIAFDTPGGPQGEVKPGMTFQLFERPLPEWLGYAPTNAVGTRLTIRFRNAEGLMSGQSDVRYRGARIGGVLEVKLAPDGRGVLVTADLGAEAAEFAREGSEFWIVRPQITAGAVRGMQAIGTGDFITGKPGRGPAKFEFEGLEQAPVLTTEEPGLNVVLLSDKGGSVQPGSPVFYRGIKVGELLGARLGPESQVVEITAHIQAHYAPLVRKNSVFWNAGGINVDLGLFGADIRAQSFKTLITGGVAFGTPDNAAEPVVPGTAFRLYDKAEDQWLNWAPVIKLDKK